MSCVLILHHVIRMLQGMLPIFSAFLLFKVAYSYTYELRPYLDLLLQILLIEDSWQTHRLVFACLFIIQDYYVLYSLLWFCCKSFQEVCFKYILNQNTGIKWVFSTSISIFEI